MESVSGEDFLNLRNDPLKLRSYVDKYVELVAVDGAVFSGKVFTIDPVSGSLVLVRQEDSETVSDLLMGHAVKSITFIIPPNENIPSNVYQPESQTSYSDEEIVSRRNRLRDWLVYNKIPIEEDGEVLRLKNAIEVRPPYDKEDCQSLDSNEMILGRMQDLISALPVLIPVSKLNNN